MDATLRLPKARLDALEPPDVEAYLLAHGWDADRVASSRELGVYHFRADRAAEILLPRSKSFIDYALRMAEVLQALATAERRTAWQVLEDLSSGRTSSSPNGPSSGQRGDGIDASAGRTKRKEEA